MVVKTSFTVELSQQVQGQVDKEVRPYWPVRETMLAVKQIFILQMQIQRQISLKKELDIKTVKPAIGST